jgi:hypothetical protein
MKTCSKCGLQKAESEFHRDPRMPDGLRRACKACAREQRRIREGVDERKIKNYELSKTGRRVCMDCGRELDVSEFRKDVDGYPYSACHECMNERQSRYKAEHRFSERTREIMRENKTLKLEGLKRCQACERVLPLSAYSTYNKGKGTYLSPYCKRCHVQGWGTGVKARNLEPHKKK